MIQSFTEKILLKYLTNVKAWIGISLGVTTITVSPAMAQEHQSSVEFVQHFTNIQNELKRERIYLHTDRQWYVHGERIWYSAYITAGSRNLPSAISKILYVELFDPDGNLIDRVTSRIESGRSSGNISFSNSPPTDGAYQLKAYTSWALNFGESYAHIADITVFTDNDTEDFAEQNSGAPDLQFFPEGGNLISSVPQRIAFKALGTDGLGRHVTGWIYNEAGSDSMRFESQYKGMGMINEWITGSSGGGYAVAEIDNEIIRVDLPAPQEYGSSLKIDSNQSNFLITINTTDEQVLNGSLLLFAHVRGEVYYASLVLMENGEGLTSVPKEQFPSGIVHFTLLNTEGNPAAERLVFNKNDLDKIETELYFDMEDHELRDEAALTITVSDGENVLVPAKASLTVFDDTFVEYDPNSTDIKSRIYLESEIRGYVEDPGYYFSDHKDADKHLDLLMLTQGWRAYNMQEIGSRSEISLFSLPDDGFNVSGTIKSGLRGRPLENATVAFSLNNDEENLQIVTTDASGKFMVSGLDVDGAAAFTIRANNENGSDRVQIELDRQFRNLEETIEPLPYHIREKDLKGMLQNQIAAETDEAVRNITERAQTAREGSERFMDAQLFGELDEITVTGRREEIDAQEQDLRFGNRPSQRIDFDKQEYLTTLPIGQVLNQMAGVSLVGNDIEIDTGFINIGYSSTPSPLILVDNIETDASYLLSLSPADVRTINVFRRSSEIASFGIAGTGGVISVRTRRGESGYVENERGTLTGRITGFQLPAQFYSPRYGVNVPRDLEETDERITLHWESDLSIPETGGTLRFWTNDVPSRYRIVLQGITNTGVPFSSTRTFVTESGTR